MRKLLLSLSIGFLLSCNNDDDSQVSSNQKCYEIYYEIRSEYPFYFETYRQETNKASTNGRQDLYEVKCY